MSKETNDMTATYPDQVTMLRRTPARIDHDTADPHRNDARGGYQRRTGSTGDDGEPPRSQANRSEHSTRGSSADAAPPRHGPPSCLASVIDIAPVLPTVATIATVFAY